VTLADRPVTRAELTAELFGAADDPLGALRWCLADLRRCCQDPVLFRGDPVQAGGEGPWLDVRALWEGTLPATEIGGILLDRVDLRNCPEFELWLMLARGRCAARSAEELRRAALSLLGTGDAEAVIDPAGRAAALDPLDESAQELLLRALVAAGHPARAAVHQTWCEALFAKEGLTVSPALRSAALVPENIAPVGLRGQGDRELPAPGREGRPWTLDRPTPGSIPCARPLARPSGPATRRCWPRSWPPWGPRWCTPCAAWTAKAPWSSTRRWPRPGPRTARR
jgi:transcriptional activator